MFKYHLLALLLGTILDYVFGRLYSMPNPFDSIERLIRFLDRALLGDDIVLLEQSKQKSLGLWLAFLVIAPVFVVTAFFTMLCFEISPVIGVIFEAIISYLCIDANYLFYGAREVMSDYYSDGISAMRHTAEDFIGKEIDFENEAHITDETITYLADGTSDFVISPIFYMFLFGPVGGFLYRTIDMMDKKMSRTKGRYTYFGYYVGKLSNILDYIPAKISGAITVFAARHTFGGFNGRNARYIHLRDKCKTISAFAGALNISLMGGKIGDADKAIEVNDIRKATTLLKNDYLLVQLILLILLLIF